jgi:subtilase family serine protease
VADPNSRSGHFHSGTILFVLLLCLYGRLYGGEPPRATKANPESLPDLAVHQVGLSKAGSVVYQVANGGNAGTGGFFVVDIYINGVRKDSIRHEALPAMSVQTAESNLARFSPCQGGTVHLVLDSQNSIRETNEKNNAYTDQLTAPCPKKP